MWLPCYVCQHFRARRNRALDFSCWNITLYNYSIFRNLLHVSISRFFFPSQANGIESSCSLAKQCELRLSQFGLHCVARSVNWEFGCYLHNKTVTQCERQQVCFRYILTAPVRCLHVYVLEDRTVRWMLYWWHVKLWRLLQLVEKCSVCRTRHFKRGFLGSKTLMLSLCNYVDIRKCINI